MNKISSQLEKQPIASVSDAELRHLTRSMELDKRSSDVLYELGRVNNASNIFYYRTKDAAEDPKTLNQFELVQRILRDPAHFISTEVVRLQSSLPADKLARIDRYGYFQDLLIRMGATYDAPLDMKGYLGLVKDAVNLSSSEAFLYKGQSGSSVITPDERGFLNFREGEVIIGVVDSIYGSSVSAVDSIGSTTVAESATLVSV